MTEKQKDFVQMYLKHNCKITAHNIVYGANSNYDSVESSANRLLNIPEIAETIRSIKDGIRAEVEAEFKAKYREELLTIYDKRLLLKKIATGEMYIEQKYKGKNCTQCSQYISPTYHMMMQALKEDSKLAGHYPHKLNGKWVIPAQQTEQVLEEDTSPLGRGWGGSTREEQEIQDENPQQITTNTSIEVHRESPTPIPLQGGEEKTEHSPQTTKDNKRQQLSEAISMRQIEMTLITNKIEETIIDNSSLNQANEGTVYTPTIISEEKLRELLYPQKPKLSYMKNNT